MKNGVLGGYSKPLIEKDRQTIAGMLQKAGYKTAGVGKWHLGMEGQHPSRRGFDVAIESHGKHFAFKTDPKMKYPQGQYLIGPSLFPLFRMVVGIVLLVFVIVQLVLFGITVVFNQEIFTFLDMLETFNKMLGRKP